jgi:hypothetical protein
MATKCYSCDLKRDRFLDEGVYYHSYKESNGYDYDSYVAPCGIQTPEGMKAYRKQSLDFVRQRIRDAKEHLAILEANAEQIKKAKDVSGIISALGRVR